MRTITPSYEVSVENAYTKYGVLLEFAKIALSGFSQETDRFVQVQTALEEIYDDYSSSRIVRIPRNISDDIWTRRDLAFPNTLTSGLFWIGLEIKYPNDKTRSLIN